MKKNKKDIKNISIIAFIFLLLGLIMTFCGYSKNNFIYASAGGTFLGYFFSMAMVVLAVKSND